ncbi:putative isochorismatase hydrolase protein [Rosellinia necatrix]|uniref:Putative isochorismatase hydrolase protein n=1 Tax=Rosellinia necatrix TaxID=77044 RepID=A0A1W2TTU4_ROSNE|nr:putative isochorismatase hydrolase protein [Rosellinia necatrix]
MLLISFLLFFQLMVRAEADGESTTTGGNLYDPSAYPPSQTALLFLDYQNILMDMVPSPVNETLVNAGIALLAAARQNNVAILHCIMDTTLDPAPTNKVTTTWASQFKPVFSANPQLGAEYAPFARTANSTSSETVFKRSPGIRSGLESEVVSYLRNQLGVKHLILGGIATSGAIMGTMSHATDINFVVTVVEDACWDPNEQVHSDLINTVIPSLAWVSSVEEAVGYMTA